MRFPAVLDQVPKVLAPSGFENAVAELHRLLDVQKTLGFVMIDQNGLRRLVAARPRIEKRPVAYIPPRIWSYQVNRLRDCLEDYLAHRQQVEECFQFCLDAYAKNYGSLTEALTNSIKSKAPFTKPNHQGSGSVSGCIFYGHFAQTADRFGLTELLDRWVDTPDPEYAWKGIRLLTNYLSLVQYAGLAYVCNFSLMRIEEASSMRADCLYWEEDEKFGRIPILCGETTKTDPDSDARWPTSPSVQIAIDAMTSVARLRMRCRRAQPKWSPSLRKTR